MNKLIYKFLIGAVSLCGAWGLTTTTISASTKLKSIPIAMRGTWHMYYSDDEFGENMYVGKHNMEFSSVGAPHHITVYKLGHWHYRFQPRGMQPLEVYYGHQHLYGKRRPMLYFYAGVVTKNESATDAYYKGAKIVKPQNYDLDYKSAPASLKDCVGKTVFSGPLADVDYPTELYPTLKDMDADTENNLVKITDSGVPMGLIKVGSYNGSHYANVSYQGNSYFVLVGDPGFSTEEVEPYNTSYADGVVSSPFKPTDKADILVKSNQWINTKYQWDYTNQNTGETYSYTFNLKKDKWE